MLRHLLLDLDGTLVDSSPGIYNSFALACTKYSLSPPSYDSFCSLIGPPIQQIAKRLYPDLDPDRVEGFRRVFRNDYDNLGYKMFRCYPDVPEIIKLLSTNPDISISIVTNKPTKPAVNLIASTGLASCFSKVVGIDYLSSSLSGSMFRSKAEALCCILESTSSQLLQSVYVGDTPSDLEACDRCNLPFIAALYGFHRWHHQEMPARCIKQFSEIQSFLLE